MSASIKKIIIGVVVGGSLLAGGYVYMAQSQYEAKAKKDVERLLSAYPDLQLKAGKVEASYFDKKVVVTDIAGGMTKDDVTVAVKIARVATTDMVDIDTFLSKEGTYKAFSELEIQGLDISTPLFGKASLESYYLKDVKADFKAIIAQGQKVYALLQQVQGDAAERVDEKAIMTTIGDFIKSMSTMHIGKVVSNKFNVTIKNPKKEESVIISYDKSEGNDYSMTHSGPASLNNMIVSLNGKTVFGIESVSLDSMDAPNYYDLMQELITFQTSAPDPMKLWNMFKENKLQVSNLRFKNIIMNDPSNPENSFKLGSTLLNLSNASPMGVAFSIDAFDMDKKVLAQKQEIPQQVYAMLPDTLSMSGAFELSLVEKSPLNFDIACKALRAGVKDLGDYNLSFELSGLNALMLMTGNVKSLALNKAALTVTDKKMSEILFTQSALQRQRYRGTTEGGDALTQDAIDTAPLRAKAAADIARQSQSLPEGVLKELATNAAAFIKSGGGNLTISINPPKPLDQTALGMAFTMSPDLLGLSSSFAPLK